MTLPFSCPHCGLETLTDDEYAGQRTVRRWQDVTVPVAVGQMGRSPRFHARRQSADGRFGRGVSIFAASVVFTLLITLVFPMFHSPGTCCTNPNVVPPDRIAHAQAIRGRTWNVSAAFIADANGKPITAGVLILPQLGEHDLRSLPSMTVDGPNNSTLVSLCRVFARPADPDARGG
jgi:hypothetical protein